MVRKKDNFKKIVREYLNHIPRDIKIEGIFLFGSYVSGKVNRDSDIDLVIISSNFRKMDFLKRLELLSHVQGCSRITRSVPMDIIGYTPEEFKEIDKESLIMREAKKRGKMMYIRRN